MRRDHFVCLTYHELEAPGRARTRAQTRYLVTASAFTQQIATLREMGLQGCCVSEAIQGRPHAVALTFDDGAASDWAVAAPILCGAACRATFYVVADRVDTSGHLTRTDLQALAGLGFEIGSHSLTHRNLPDLNMRELHLEIAKSKDQLEQYVGAPVSHLSCPFGGYNRTILELALESGYKTVATSRVGTNCIGSTALKRLSVRRGTTLSGFSEMICGRGLLYHFVRQGVLNTIRSVVGFSAYSTLCAARPWQELRNRQRKAV